MLPKGEFSEWGEAGRWAGIGQLSRARCSFPGPGMTALAVEALFEIRGLPWGRLCRGLCNIWAFFSTYCMPPALPVSLPSPPLLSKTFMNPHNIPQNSSVTRRLAASGKDRGNEKGGGFTRFTERVRKERLDKLGSYLISLRFLLFPHSWHLRPQMAVNKNNQRWLRSCFPLPFQILSVSLLLLCIAHVAPGGSSYLCRVEHPHRPFDLPISPWALLDRLIYSAATSVIDVKWREEH